MESPNEDEGLSLLDGLDYDAQFHAIRNLLARQEQANQGLEDKIELTEGLALRLNGDARQHAVDESVDLMHGSCYQEAAHSMAAVGMVAPFIESVFRQGFPGPFRRILKEEEDKSLSLAKKIMILIDEVSMRVYMPEDLEQTLSALFTYRNNMFHNGLEWPPKELKNFDSRLKNSGWPSDWFSKAKVGDEPWMFYMSQIFVDHCIDQIEKVIDGIEEFNVDRILKRQQRIATD